MLTVQRHKLQQSRCLWPEQQGLSGPGILQQAIPENLTGFDRMLMFQGMSCGYSWSRHH